MLGTRLPRGDFVSVKIVQMLLLVQFLDTAMAGQGK
jgi:hypothetical protein